MMKYFLYFLATATLAIFLTLVVSYIDALKAEKAANLAIAEKTNYELQQKIALDKQKEEARILAEQQREIEVAQKLEEEARYQAEQKRRQVIIADFLHSIAAADAAWLKQRDIWNKCPKSMMEDNGECYDREDAKLESLSKDVKKIESDFKSKYPDIVFPGFNYLRGVRN